MLIYIYKIELVETGECYIGSTKKPNPKERYREHKFKLRRGTHHSSFLQEVWTKTNNEESFIFCILEECTEQNRFAREQWWIDNTNSVLNGSRSAYSPAYDPRIIEKMTATINKKVASGNWTHAPLNKGKDHPMYGKKFPQERKDNIAKALMGNKNSEGNILSDQHKIAISHARTGISQRGIGWSHSEDTKQKMSDTQKGKILMPEHNITCHAWERTNETKEKMSQAKKGKLGNHRKEYIITFPDGHSETIKGLSNFCTQYNLKATGFHRVLNGTTEQNNYKGYKISLL